MINSITLSTIKDGKSAIFFVILGLICLYLFITITPTNDSDKRTRNADIFIHKGNEPISLPFSGSAINWQKAQSSEFNLGNYQFGIAQVTLATSEVHTTDDLIIAITRNNRFTDIVLHYQHGGFFLKKAFKASTSDNKLLIAELPTSTSPQTVYLSLSGRYLRGKIHIFTPKELSQYIKDASIKDGIYFGITALFLLFSLLSYILFRKPIFLKYAALLSSMFLWVAAGEGWVNSYLPRLQSLPIFTANSLGLLYFIAFAYFSYDYLKLSHHTSTGGKVLKYCQRLLLFIWLCYCLSFNRSAALLYQVFYGLVLITCLIVLSTSLVIAVRSLPAHGKQGRFYIAAIGVFLFCAVLSGLSMTNIVDLNVGWMLIKISSITEMLLLATGLMYWYRETMVKLVDKQMLQKTMRADTISSKRQTSQNEDLQATRQNNDALCPQIAKLVALIDKTLYIKAAGNYSEVIYQDGKVFKNKLVDTNLRAIENVLGSDKLTRCHKSYLVKQDRNFQLIRRTSADYDLVLNEHRVPVGRKYLKIIKLIFERENVTNGEVE